MQSLKRTCWAIVLPTRSFVFLCPRCRRRGGLLKVPILKSHNVIYYKLEVGSRPMETFRTVVFTIWQLWSKISAYKEETSSRHKLTAVQQFIGWTEYNRKDVQVAQCKKLKWPDQKFLPGFQDLEQRRNLVFWQRNKKRTEYIVGLYKHAGIFKKTREVLRSTSRKREPLILLECS